MCYPKVQSSIVNAMVVCSSFFCISTEYFSLYPSVQKKNFFPTALHPNVYTAKDLLADGGPVWTKERLASYFGMVHCIIRPPDDLLIPVLPYRVRGKCIFALCHQCALQNNQSDVSSFLVQQITFKISCWCTFQCHHMDKQRNLFGCWTTVDLLDALDADYVIEHVLEIWDWAHKPLTNKMFAPFVNAIMKCKVESGGCPQGLSPTQVAKMWLDAEQIKIDPQMLTQGRNDPMYITSKIIANSQW